MLAKTSGCGVLDLAFKSSYCKGTSGQVSCFYHKTDLSVFLLVNLKNSLVYTVSCQEYEQVKYDLIIYW